jgi:DNA-binding transcriptional LysR family regulator
VAAFASADVVARAFQGFRKLYPDVYLKLAQNRKEMDVTVTPPDLFVTTLMVAPDLFHTHLLLREELYAGLPPDHPLAKSETLRMEQLGNEHFIKYADTELQDIIIGYCRISGFTPISPVSSTDIVKTCKMIASGVGVSLIPNSWREAAAGRIALVLTESPRCERTIRIAWHKEAYLRKPAELFRDYLIENFYKILHS